MPVTPNNVKLYPAYPVDRFSEGVGRWVPQDDATVQRGSVTFPMFYDQSNAQDIYPQNGNDYGVFESDGASDFVTLEFEDAIDLSDFYHGTNDFIYFVARTTTGTFTTAVYIYTDDSNYLYSDDITITTEWQAIKLRKANMNSGGSFVNTSVTKIAFELETKNQPLCVDDISICSSQKSKEVDIYGWDGIVRNNSTNFNVRFIKGANDDNFNDTRKELELFHTRGLQVLNSYGWYYKFFQTTVGGEYVKKWLVQVPRFKKDVDTSWDGSFMIAQDMSDFYLSSFLVFYEPRERYKSSRNHGYVYVAYSAEETR